MPTVVRLFKNFGRMFSSAPSNRPFRTVIVEGNIASGKTVFLEYFQKFANAKIFTEPVEKWRDLNGHNMLDLLYRDSSRWSFAFQMYADLTRLSIHQSTENLENGGVKLMERSLYSGKYCFAENSYRSGNMNSAEYAVLNEYFQWMTANQPEMLNVDLIVYLQTRPEICYQRLLKRCRKEETAIPLEYLQRLHELYEEWLVHKKQPLPADVLIIDANDDLSAMHSKYDQLASKILSPVSSTNAGSVTDENSRTDVTSG